MKTVRVISFTICLAVLALGAVGCSALDGIINPRFDIPEYGLTVSGDFGFTDVTVDGPFDLQITNGFAYISVYAYHYSDFTDGSTPEDIYEYHNTDLFSRRENVKTVQEETSAVLEGKTAVKTVYSAELDGVENHYVSYLLDFGEEEIFAWILVTATPEYIEANIDDLQKIVYSMNTVTD